MTKIGSRLFTSSVAVFCRGGPPWPPPSYLHVGAATEDRPYNMHSMRVYGKSLLYYVESSHSKAI